MCVYVCVYMYVCMCMCVCVCVCGMNPRMHPYQGEATSTRGRRDAERDRMEFCTPSRGEEGEAEEYAEEAGEGVPSHTVPSHPITITITNTNTNTSKEGLSVFLFVTRCIRR